LYCNNKNKFICNKIIEQKPMSAGNQRPVRGPGIKLTDFKRGYMNAMHDDGHCAIEIAHRMKIECSTVYEMIKKGFKCKKNSKVATIGFR
jgi:hypothetical protein